MKPWMGNDGPMAARNQFKKRSCLFQTGTFMLIVAATLLTLGFGYPDWNDDWGGLWRYYREGTLYKNTELVAADVDAVRAMECLAVLFAWLSVAIELYQDGFKKRHTPTNNMAVEILAVIAGVFGLIGAIIFGVRRPCLSPGLSFDIPSQNVTSFAYPEVCEQRSNLGWAFFVTTISSFFLPISAVVISNGRRQAMNGSGQSELPYTASSSHGGPWTTQQGTAYPAMGSAGPRGVPAPGQAIPIRDIHQNWYPGEFWGIERPFSNRSEFPQRNERGYRHSWSYNR